MSVVWLYYNVKVLKQVQRRYKACCQYNEGMQHQSDGGTQQVVYHVQRGRQVSSKGMLTFKGQNLPKPGQNPDAGF